MSTKFSIKSVSKFDPKAERKHIQAVDLFLKIMAQKNINIVYDHTYHTAFANLDTNTIHLPTYILENKSTYLRFATHEVAHILYTPRFFYEKHDNNMSSAESRTVTIKGKKYTLDNDLFNAINVIEDIRIEKLIRNNFPGLIRHYRESAKGLLETTTWSYLKQLTTQEEFDKLTLLNKINVKSKFKEYLSQVALSSREYAILKWVSRVKTFADVLVASRYLYLLEKTNTDVNNASMSELQDLLTKAKGRMTDTSSSQQTSTGMNSPIDFDEKFDELDMDDILNTRHDEEMPENTDVDTTGIAEELNDMSDIVGEADNKWSEHDETTVGNNFLRRNQTDLHVTSRVKVIESLLDRREYKRKITKRRQISSDKLVIRV